MKHMEMVCQNTCLMVVHVILILNMYIVQFFFQKYLC